MGWRLIDQGKSVREVADLQRPHRNYLSALRDGGLSAFSVPLLPNTQIHRIPYCGGVPLRQIRATLAELEHDDSALRDAGWLSVMVPLTAPDPDLNGKVRRLLPNVLVVDSDLPQENERPPEIDRASLSPADLFRAYFRKEHGGAEPADDLVEAFTELRHEAEGGEE